MSILKSSIFFVLLFWIGTLHQCFAQKEKKKIIQLSGIILSEDSTAGVPGAHVYIPKSGRGTVSTAKGYFSLPILEGDSVVFSSIGYNQKYYIVPKGLSEQFLTIIIRMTPSITELEEINILPFPTEEAFKAAVLALNVPMDEFVKLNFNTEEFQMLLNATAMDDYANYRYYSSQYVQYIDDRFRGRTNPFLNPFNWYNFFQSLKKKDDKKKK